MPILKPFQAQGGPAKVKINLAITLFFFCFFFYEHSVFLGQPRYAYDFSNFSHILCLQYAENNGFYYYGHDQITMEKLLIS